MWRVECQKYMCLLAALGLFIAHFIHFVYAHSVAGSSRKACVPFNPYSLDS